MKKGKPAGRKPAKRTKVKAVRTKPARTTTKRVRPEKAAKKAATTPVGNLLRNAADVIRSAADNIGP